jgi:RNA polymerase sigma-70 factor (ECF subfamily)
METDAAGHGQDVKVAVTPPQQSAGQGPAPDTEGMSVPSLEALYREHFQFVWRTARRLGVQQAQLDDAVQDVFMVVHRQLASYEPRQSPRSWLFSITRRVAADHRRTLRRKGGWLPLQAGVASRASDDPLRGALTKERSDVVLAFLDGIDDMHREVFILCELEQMSAPEIASAVNASTSAVYSRIRAARIAFARYVQDHHPDLMGETDG